MPIEIRELVIRAVVEAPPRDDDEDAAPAFDAAARARLIQDCVAEVMRQLRRSREP